MERGGTADVRPASQADSWALSWGGLGRPGWPGTVVSHGSQPTFTAGTAAQRHFYSTIRTE